MQLERLLNVIIELIYEGQKEGLWKFKGEKLDVEKKVNIETPISKQTLLSKKIDWKYITKLTASDGDRYNFCDKDGRCFKTTEDLYLFEQQEAYKKDK